MTKTTAPVGTLAENFIQNGTWDAQAVGQLNDEQLEELLDRLVARAAIEAAAEAAATDKEMLSAEHQATALSLQSFYLGEISRAQSTIEEQSERLARPATWLAIKPVVRDSDFLVRLGQRRLRNMAVSCVRDLADLVGVSKAALEHFFAGPAGEGLAFAENRASGKPQDDGMEDFAAALARSSVPDVLKRRWSEEDT